MSGETSRAEAGDGFRGDRSGRSVRPAAGTERTERDARTVSVTGDEAEDLLELLSDEATQRILDVLDEDSLPARSVVAACDTSRATVYRRLNRLQEYDLVGVDTELHPDGHHRKVFAKRFRRATVELVDGVPEIGLVIRGQAPDDDRPARVTAD